MFAYLQTDLEYRSEHPSVFKSSESIPVRPTQTHIFEFTEFLLVPVGALLVRCTQGMSDWIIASGIICQIMALID